MCLARGGGRFNGDGGESHVCAASQSRATRWASVLCDQVHRGSVWCVMVSLIVAVYTAIIHCG